MASRDTELTAFVDARGSALMRTASLLAPDDADTILVEALARTARRWREATVDDDVERYARHELYTAVVSRWRKDGGLDVDDATGAGDAEPAARRLLRAGHAASAPCSFSAATRGWTPTRSLPFCA